MKKIYFYQVAFMLLLSVAAQTVCAQQKAPDKRIQTIERNKIDNSPASVTFDAGAKISDENPQEIFREFLGINPDVVTMKLKNATQTKQNYTIKRYTQYIKGIKVAFGDYSLISKNGMVTFMTGNVYNVSEGIATSSKIKEPAALQAALKSINAEKYMWEIPAMEEALKVAENNTQATYHPKGEQVWMEDRSSGQPDRKLHLAYRFNIYAAEPLSRDDVYVDATTGKVLFVNKILAHTSSAATGASLYSGTVPFNTEVISGGYKLSDPTRGSGINTFNMHNTNGSGVTTYTNTTTTWPSDAGIDAHWGATQVYDYWNGEQGRNGFDGEGSALNSYVHYFSGYNNAFWDGSAMYYGDGTGISAGGFSPLTSLDVCAHEIGHAICQYTAGLIYAGEAGAMNEGLSDIWGAVIENWANPHESDAVAKSTYAIGEEIGANPLRRMDFPNIRHNPGTYNGTYWTNNVGCSPTDLNDYCGVHNNSGVLNHWFYLMSEGGSGTNENGHAYSVSGIGINTGAGIVYGTELALSSTADYALFRSTSINVATTMYGACSPQVQAVRNAWYAVGVFSSEDASAGAGSISGASSVCLGSAITLSDGVSGGNWISQHPTVASVDAAGVVTGVSEGTVNIFYSVMTSCGKVSAGKLITVSASPADLTITPSSATICAGNGAKLKITTPAIAAITTYNFNAGLGSWTVDNSGSTAVDALTPWQVHPDGFTDEFGTWHSPDNSSFVQTNADIGGEGTLTQSKLISPVFALTGYSSYVLSFDHAFIPYSDGDVNVEIDISTDGGSSWSVLHNYLDEASTDFTEFTPETIDLTAYAGMSNLRLRYFYKSEWGYYWAIDNVVLGGIIPAPQHATWSPSAGLYTNAGLTVAYTGTTVDSVYAAPSATQTYTGTVTNAYGCGTSLTSAITVNSVAPISGSSSLCIGASITLTNATSGGTWTSSNTSIATINSSGVVSGLASGTTIISYQSPTCGYATKTITVNALPAAITGTTGLCPGTMATLACSPGGGSWTSSNTSVATVNATSGLVTGVSNGSSTISYTLSAGCGSSTVVTVGASLAAISGTLAACVGSTTTLTDATPGGSWTSANTSVATVNATSGLVSALSAGTSRITYTASGCYTTAIVTVVTTPAAIAGSLSMCLGNSTTLSSASTGGSWSSSNTGVATVNATTGVVSSVSTGTATIMYMIGSCSVSAIVTVGAGAGANTGSPEVCVGQNTDLDNSTSGGTWTSSDLAIATVHAATGLVTGISTGTAAITYILSPGCNSVTIVTVNATMSPIAGTTGLCIGSTTTLTNATGTGTWSSGNPYKATIDASTGFVTAIAAGTTSITYMISSGCYATEVVTVNAVPAAITGTATACTGATTALSSTPGGGSWTSSNTSSATISSTGVVTGAAAGTSTISYTLPTGCAAKRDVTITALPAAIGGSLTACIGATSTLTSSPTGGIWSISSTYIATINYATGALTGMHAGTARVTYTASAGCYIVDVVTVNAAPSAITGIKTVCVGSNTTLGSATWSGTWSSDDVSIATIDATSGVASGIGAGTVFISYSTGTCAATTILTVNAGVAPCTGDPVVCVGQGSPLANASSGGTWSSSATAKATVNSSGLVAGVSTGTANITYKLSASCYNVTVVSVNATPSSITGVLSVCPGSTTALGHATAGGTWTSSNTYKATIDIATGIATGVASGTATITYRLSAGCFKTGALTVSTAPAGITGTAILCSGSTTTLASATSGGVWTSSDPTTASVTAGTVTGGTIGMATISYSTGGGCVATKEVTVTAAPTAITGSASVCVGNTSLLSSTPAGGAWSSSNTSKATVGAGTGLVSGISAGTANITYALTATCRSIVAVSVGITPSAISGLSTLCSGGTITMSAATAGGAWSSSDGAVATVGAATGIVTGTGAGVANISYTVGGCSATKSITVSISGGSISGDAVVCAGQTNSSLTTGLSGGTWSSSASATANVNASTGLITGVSPGTATITYTASPGCFITRVATVNAAVNNITGPPSVILGNTITLANATTGGTWSSSNTYKATIVAGTGDMTGIAAGTTTITYMVSAGCYKTVTETVTYSRPGSFTGSTVTTFALYPNPSAGIITIEALVNGMLSLYTIDGKLISEYLVSGGKLTINLPQHLATGIYVCRFSGEDGSSEIITLIIEH